MDFVDKIGGLTKNPLGIIALFISLIYGMSALLLGASIGSLSPVNQTVLVSFIAGFPFVVLGVFAWLVARHHSKLYGPGDYRSDESFLNARVIQADVIGLKIRAELEEAAEASVEAPKPISTSDAEVSEKKAEFALDSIKAESITASSITVTSQDVAQAFIVQSLVANELQKEFGGYLGKELRFGDRSVDAVIHRDGGIMLVEVKNFLSPNITARRTKLWVDQLEETIRAASAAGFKVHQGILAIVTDDHGRSSYQLNRLTTLVSKGILIKYYDRDTILKKYNLPTVQDLTADALKIK